MGEPSVTQTMRVFRWGARGVGPPAMGFMVRELRALRWGARPHHCVFRGSLARDPLHATGPDHLGSRVFRCVGSPGAFSAAGGVPDAGGAAGRMVHTVSQGGCRAGAGAAGRRAGGVGPAFFGGGELGDPALPWRYVSGTVWRLRTSAGFLTPLKRRTNDGQGAQIPGHPSTHEEIHEVAVVTAIIKAWWLSVHCSFRGSAGDGAGGGDPPAEFTSWDVAHGPLASHGIVHQLCPAAGSADLWPVPEPVPVRRQASPRRAVSLLPPATVHFVTPDASPQDVNAHAGA
jgi:hypothetical protein